ncbi:MAG: TerD domain-containing protein [Selenomonadaceae bacterium]|nr:TerD domain-containing protein [Selenomonadaceae bacterium]
MSVELKKGQKFDLTKTNPNLKRLLIGLGWSSGQGVDLDTAAFLLGSDGKAASDDDFIFYGNLTHKSGSVQHSGDNVTGGTGDVEQIHADLTKIPQSINKIAFTVTIYDADARRQNFSNVHGAYIRIIDEDNGTELAHFNLGDSFSVETAVVAAEIYRHKGNWKFNAIGAGFSGGLAALCKNFGIDVTDDTNTSSPTPNISSTQQPTPTPPQPTSNAPTSSSIQSRRGPTRLDPPGSSRKPTRLDPPNANQAAHSVSSSIPPTPPKKVELRKGQKISLVKTGNTLGEIVINLNWSQPVRSSRQSTGLLSRIFGSKQSNSIDLDLACLYELKNGDKGVVQALGNCFGSLNNAPYIALDGDDRSGSNAAGETIRVNGKHVDKIKRILVFTFIYEGVANWREADGVVTVKCPGSPDIIVRMDEYNSDLPNCGIALLENQGGTFSVEKIVKFYPSTRYLDQDFGWGLRWTTGRKD